MCFNILQYRSFWRLLHSSDMLSGGILVECGFTLEFHSLFFLASELHCVLNLFMKNVDFFLM